PGAIARLHIDPIDGLAPDAARDLVERAGLDPAVTDQVTGVVLALWSAYGGADAELVEVNPLAVVADGRVLALDAKVTLDDNAAWRHPGWEEWRHLEDLDPRERAARERGLTYVGLDGRLGIIGNGAGLVMSTVDVVAQAG